MNKKIRRWQTASQEEIGSQRKALANPLPEWPVDKDKEERRQKESIMLRKLQTALTVAGLFGGLAISSALAQSGDDKKMSDDKMAGEKMSGKKMSHQEMMDKMAKMSVDDKAAMFDKMTEKDKMSAMKMGGHDMGNMSHQEMMDMMGKMSAQEKADMFDKMPMEKKMSMMQGGSMMHKSKKMDKGTMDKDTMDKQ